MDESSIRDSTAAANKFGPGEIEGVARSQDRNLEAPGPTAAEMGYVWRIPGCGCIVAAQVDRPEYQRDVAKFKRDKRMGGFTLAHLPVEEIRSLPWGWPCEHMKPRQEALSV